jgi:hypothetical protein
MNVGAEREIHGEELTIIAPNDARRCLSDMLFIFGYPQFDCFMPSLLEHARTISKERKSIAYVQDVFINTDTSYATERAERIGRALGVRIVSAPCNREKLPSRILRTTERDIDGILAEYLDDTVSVIHRIVDSNDLRAIDEEKSIPLRIRRKGMLCQVAMWFESYNLVLVE